MLRGREKAVLRFNQTSPQSVFTSAAATSQALIQYDLGNAESGIALGKCCYTTAVIRPIANPCTLSTKIKKWTPFKLHRYIEAFVGKMVKF
jgi:hypothetical protein